MTQPSKQAIIRDFDKAAQNYDEHAIVQRETANHLFSLIKPRLSNETIVLDAGCGTGYFHELLRKNKIYCPLTQIDIAFGMCTKADEYASPPEYGGTHTCVADVESLPFSADSFDIVFSSLTLQWACDISTPLAEINRSLEPHGRIAISTIGAGTLHELADSFAQMDTLPHINNFITQEKLKSALQSSGYKNIQISQKTITQQHKTLRDLLQSIKGVGAAYKSTAPRKYLGKNYFAKLEQIYYENFPQNDLLPASWNIIYAVADK
jgi:malonyl-CoA O-methyltransferase